jgi:cell division protease FtsH
MDKRPKFKKEPAKPGSTDYNRVRLALWLIILVFIIFWLWQTYRDRDGTVKVSYSSFRQQLQHDNIEYVTVKGDTITGELTEPTEKEITGPDDEEKRKIAYTQFKTFLPSFGDATLLALLEEKGVEVKTEPAQEAAWWGVLVALSPFIFLIFLGYLMFRGVRAQGQNIFSMGGSKARLYERSDEKTTFDDIAGAEGAKLELSEIIEFLRDPRRFQKIGAKTPKGVLLVGPPGTGKTLLARAVAGEAEVPFFSITGSDFMEMFVGVGASRVRNMFQEAKRIAPSIIFIDELDSIGRQRGAGLGGGHDEREQTLNQLLSELDGFEPHEGIIVMAATNRPDILDSALLRPGRLDRRISVDLPTLKDREEILKIHAKNKPLANEVNLKQVARSTPGFSGADLENLLNESALLAARKDKEVVETKDLEEARDKILMGLAKTNLILTKDECRMLAYHEAGHALVAAVLPHADPVHKVTIVPRGRAMGVTQQLPEKEKYIYPKEYILDRLAVMMGGRAAELLVLKTVTSGAENDLKQATSLARKMVLDWGMSGHLGHMVLGGRHEHIFLGEEIAQKREYSEATAQEIDEEIKKILNESYHRAAKTLEEHQGKLHQLAEALLEKEEIAGNEVLKIFDGKYAARDSEESLRL